jgi:hypothetical protein
MVLLVITAGYIYVTYFGEKPETLVEDIVLTKDKSGGNIQIDFASPVRHVGHFPEGQGDILQIKLRAISFHEFSENYSLVTKFLQIHRAKDYHIADVRYEGNVPGGPFLIVKFTKPMEFALDEGEGLKALLINYKAI